MLARDKEGEKTIIGVHDMWTGSTDRPMCYVWLIGFLDLTAIYLIGSDTVLVNNQII